MNEKGEGPIQYWQFNYIRLSIILFVAILTFFLMLSISPKRTCGDFHVYYASSHNYLSGNPIYIAHEGIEEFKYSPLFALVFSPFTMLQEHSALYLWSVLNIFLLYLIFYLFYKLKLVSFATPRDLLLIFCLFALTGRFIFENIKIGQINILLCCLLVLTMYWEKSQKDFLASIALAFSLMIKFFPLLFLVYFLLKRRFRLAGLTGLMVVFFLLLPSIYSGLSLNLKYIHEWFLLLKLTPAPLLYSVKNNSFLSFYSWVYIAGHGIYYIFDYGLIKTGLTSAVYWAWAGTCFVFFAGFFYDTIVMRNDKAQISYWDYACLFVCCLLFNPLAYLNALVLLIVPYFFVLRYLIYSKWRGKYILPIAFLVLLGLILNIVDHKMFYKDIYQYYVILQYKPLMWTMIFLYFSLCICKRSEC